MEAAYRIVRTTSVSSPGCLTSKSCSCLLVQASLRGEVVQDIAAGSEHSLCVTKVRQLKVYIGMHAGGTL